MLKSVDFSTSFQRVTGPSALPLGAARYRQVPVRVSCRTKAPTFVGLQRIGPDNIESRIEGPLKKLLGYVLACSRLH